MADREVVGIELVAKLDQLRSEFKSLPKTTDDETKKAVSLALKNLTRLEKGAAKSAASTAGAVAPGAAKAADALKGLDASAKALGETAGDTDSSLKAVAGAVGLISPAAETALSSIGDLAGGIEGAVKAAKLASVSLGAIGLAAAGIALVATAIYGVWTATEETRAKTAEWEAALKDVTTQTKTLASAQKALAGAGDDVAGFIGNLQIQSAVLRGEIDEVDVKLGEMGSTLSDTLKPALEEARQAFVEQGKQADLLRAQMRDGSLSAMEMLVAENKLAAVVQNQDAIKGKIKAIKDLQTTGNEQINEYGKALREAAAKEEAAKEATKDRATASKLAKEEVRDHAGVLRVLETSLGAATSAYEALSREETASMTQLTELGATEEELALARERYAARRVELTKATTAKVLSIEEGAYESLASLAATFSTEKLSDEQKFAQEYIATRAKIVEAERLAQEELATIRAEAEAGGDIATIEAIGAQKIELEQQTQEALTRLHAEGSARRTEISNAALEAHRASVLATATSFAQGLSSISGDLASMSGEVASLIADNNAEGAERAFKVQKAAAKAQVGVDTAKGIMDVWSEHAANPILAGLLTIPVVAAGAIQIAKINSQDPAFHVGGIVPGYGASHGTGEVSARLLPNEVVLNRQAVQSMGGPEAANRLNTGGGMGGSITLNQVWRGSTLDRVVYDVSRLPGSKTRQLTQGGRVGKRTR